MKKYHFNLFVILFVSLLSGCSLVHLAESVALLPVAIVDGVAGTHMVRSIDNGIKQSLRPGSPMDKQSIHAKLSGKTIFFNDTVAYLKANSNMEAIVKPNNNKQVKKTFWAVDNGEVWVNGLRYELREKDNIILVGISDQPLTMKNGDVENLTAQLENQLKQEAEKQAELEHKRAEEKAAQQQAEAEQLAQEKVEVEQHRAALDAKRKELEKQAEKEERCMKTPSCRAKKEREEHQRELAAKRGREEACDRLYTGKSVYIHVEHCTPGIFLLVRSTCSEEDLQAQITGISKANGVATAQITQRPNRVPNGYYGRSYEKNCSEF
jgi:hypothetical protein